MKICVNTILCEIEGKNDAGVNASMTSAKSDSVSIRYSEYYCTQSLVHCTLCCARLLYVLVKVQYCNVWYLESESREKPTEEGIEGSGNPEKQVIHCM